MNVNPEVGNDPKNVLFQLMLVLWKYQSKIWDLKIPVIKHSNFLMKLYRSYRTRVVRLSNRIILTSAWVHDEYKSVSALAEGLVDLKIHIRRAASRLDAVYWRCISMAWRVDQELLRVNQSAPNPSHKKTLHPDMSPEALQFFVRQCLDVAKSAMEVIQKNSQYEKLLDIEVQRSVILLTQYHRELQYDPNLTLRITYQKQWRSIQQYERTSLKTMSYCVYSCAYRPLNTVLYCSWCFRNVKLSAPEDGYKWRLTKLFHDFYNEVFKELVQRLLPSKSITVEDETTQIDSFLLSNSSLTEAFRNYVHNEKPPKPVKRSARAFYPVFQLVDEDKRMKETCGKHEPEP